MDLNAIAVFVKVVESGSFIAAAQALELPRTNVSRMVARLEADLGARLLHRTTRKLSLTDIGAVYFERCQGILGEVEEANLAVTQLQSIPRGTLRIAAPILFGTTVLSDWLVTFMVQYPALKVEVLLSNQYLDLAKARIDVAFRVGAVGDSSLDLRSLGAIPYWLCASPTYLAEQGSPRHPQDLNPYTAILLANQRHPWQLQRGSNRETVTLVSRLRTNDLEVAHRAAIAGLGIAYLPALLIADSLRQGRLVRLLPDWETLERDLFLVYPGQGGLSAKVQAFIHFVETQVQPHLPWDSLSLAAEPLPDPLAHS